MMRINCRLKALIFVGAVFLLLMTLPVRASPQEDYLDRVAPVAQEICRQYGIPPSAYLGMSALESGWGRSWLAVNANNYFGRKCLSDPCVEVWTPEYRDGIRRMEPHMFQVYPTLRAAIHGYCQQFFRTWPDRTPIYKFDARNAEAFIRSIVPPYATDPEYIGKVLGIIRRYDLTRYDQISP